MITAPVEIAAREIRTIITMNPKAPDLGKSLLELLVAIGGWVIDVEPEELEVLAEDEELLELPAVRVRVAPLLVPSTLEDPL